MPDWRSILESLVSGMPQAHNQGDVGAMTDAWLNPMTRPEVSQYAIPEPIEMFLDPGRTGFQQEFDKYHPADQRVGLLERLIRGGGRAGNKLVDEDIPFLEQYLHPEVDVLPKTNLRPTQARVENMPYRGLPTENRKQGVKLARRGLERSIPGRKLFQNNPVLHEANQGFRRGARVGGLGNYVESRGPGYASVYDKWDFDTDAEGGYGRADPVVKWLMRQAGQPFAVYDRILDSELSPANQQPPGRPAPNTYSDHMWDRSFTPQTMALTGNQMPQLKGPKK